MVSTDAGSQGGAGFVTVQMEIKVPAPYLALRDTMAAGEGEN